MCAALLLLLVVVVVVVIAAAAAVVIAAVVVVANCLTARHDVVVVEDVRSSRLQSGEDSVLALKRVKALCGVALSDVIASICSVLQANKVAVVVVAMVVGVVQEVDVAVSSVVVVAVVRVVGVVAAMLWERLCFARAWGDGKTGSSQPGLPNISGDVRVEESPEWDEGT